MNFKSSVIAAAMTVLASSAFAADYASFADLANFDDSTANIGATWKFDTALASDKTFESVVQFTLSLVNDANGAVTLSNNSKFNLSVGKVELKQGAVTLATDLTPADFSFAGLTAGTYQLVVSGTLTSGYKGGSWGGNLNTVSQPVPEPETYALMLAGLGAVAFVARRRKAA